MHGNKGNILSIFGDDNNNLFFIIMLSFNITTKKVCKKHSLALSRPSRRVYTVTKVNNDLTTVVTMRTNVLGDFIEKFNNDIAIVESNNDYSDEYKCKYVALFRLGLFVVVLIFMFIDWDGKNENTDHI